MQGLPISGGSYGRGPSVIRRASESSECRSADQATLDVKAVVDGAMGSNEALGLTLRFEPLHFSFSPADGQVRVFNPVIVS